MLFNSYFFIFLFLPVVLIVFHFIGNRGHHRVAISWLVGASLFFYGWWNPAYLGVILTSIIFNYAIGVSLGSKPTKLTLIFGIVVNLSSLLYFKYANFFVDNINVFINGEFHLEKIILPLAISFFTFQQITYLVDAYKGLTKEYNFLHYCLFVTFFPQLIAGPIVHHKEMMPQFSDDNLYKLKSSNLVIGITIFILGLFKKVIFADNISSHSTPIFEAAESGIVLTFVESWGGAFAYTLQLYFDFSGYSDMALGLARMFGVILPINFYSPYKATSIIEFWRRWHITLSSFLRDYIYFPLGGNRKGQTRRYINLMLTMLIGGLWHGAGWTFIIWGGMHGIYLSINHGWNVIVNSKSSLTRNIFGQIITFTFIVIAWVMFRATSLEGAMTMYSGMFGFNGISLPVWSESRLSGYGALLISVLLMIVWFAPNTLYLMRNENPALNSEQFITEHNIQLCWKPTLVWVLILVIITLISLTYMLGSVSEFLYFQF